MTIAIETTTSPKELMARLEDLALSRGEGKTYVFRGHQKESWRTQSTLARYSSVPHRAYHSRLDKMLSHFLINALSVGTVPFNKDNRRARLEYGRHFGVPSPLIDFSWSPYVALFFALNGVDDRPGAGSENAAVYALNIEALGISWAHFLANRHGGDTHDRHTEFNKIFDEFRWEKEQADMFKDVYPENKLKFIRFPASWNQRMHRQLGCFLYDTIDYARMGHKDFESLVESFNFPTAPCGEMEPTMHKILFPLSYAGEAFTRLELMGITATRLLDHAGLADDVINSRHYDRKTGYSWDLDMPPPDDMKGR